MCFRVFKIWQIFSLVVAVLYAFRCSIGPPSFIKIPLKDGNDLNSIISSITSWCVVHYDYINMSCSTSRIVISNITTSIPIGPICGVKGNCQERLVYISDPLDTSATVYIQCSINPCRTCTEFVFRNTARCRYNVVNFLQNPHKRHPIARPLGPGVGCLLCVQTLICILSQ